MFLLLTHSALTPHSTTQLCAMAKPWQGFGPVCDLPGSYQVLLVRKKTKGVMMPPFLSSLQCFPKQQMHRCPHRSNTFIDTDNVSINKLQKSITSIK